jgi:hypothetical protein
MYDIFITEKELLGKTYELWKSQQASPAIIQFAILMIMMFSEVPNIVLHNACKVLILILIRYADEIL